MNFKKLELPIAAIGFAIAGILLISEGGYEMITPGALLIILGGLILTKKQLILGIAMALSALGTLYGETLMLMGMGYARGDTIKILASILFVLIPLTITILLGRNLHKQAILTVLVLGAIAWVILGIGIVSLVLEPQNLSTMSIIVIIIHILIPVSVLISLKKNL